MHGSKLLADARTDNFHSGPLRPANQHTTTPLTDQHMFSWQRLRSVEVVKVLTPKYFCSDHNFQKIMLWRTNFSGFFGPPDPNFWRTQIFVTKLAKHSEYIATSSNMTAPLAQVFRDTRLCQSVCIVSQIPTKQFGKEISCWSC